MSSAEYVNSRLLHRGSLSPRQTKLLVCCVGLAIAALDWLSPADVNPAIFYAFGIGLCSWTRSTRWLWASTVIFAFLSLGIYQFGTPATGVHFNWVDSTNRYLTVCALFLVAAFVQMQMRAAAALQVAREYLEDRVKDRTSELETANSELRQQAKLVRELSGRLLMVQDDERRRIARELHDSVGQSLAAVGMHIAVVQAQRGQLAPGTAQAIAESAILIEEVQTEIRTLSYLLHPPLLDEIGLRSALQWYIDGFSARSKIKTTLDLPQDFPRAPRDLELCIFRVVQESLTNVHRHSGSSVAAVRLAIDGGSLHVEVKDQGRGIAADKQQSLSSNGHLGVGIPGMQERVRQFGGRFSVSSSPSGTLVLATVPLTLSAQLEGAKLPVPISSEAPVKTQRLTN